MVAILSRFEIAVTIGVLGAIGLAGIGRSLAPRRELLVYGVGLGITAVAYLVFGVQRGAPASHLGLELVGAGLFGIAAVLGTRRWPALLAFGWTAHVAWDLFFHYANGPAFAPACTRGFASASTSSSEDISRAWPQPDNTSPLPSRPPPDAFARWAIRHDVAVGDPAEDRAGTDSGRETHAPITAFNGVTDGLDPNQETASTTLVPFVGSRCAVPGDTWSMTGSQSPVRSFMSRPAKLGAFAAYEDGFTLLELTRKYYREIGRDVRQLDSLVR